MIDLGSPIGWKKEFYENKNEVDEFMARLEVPVDEKNRYKFTDLLEKLVILAVI